MATVAYTKISHGQKDGTVVTIDEGAEVKNLPTDVVKELKELGVVGPPLDAQAAAKVNEELQTENDELRAQLEALQAQLAESEPVKTDGNADGNAGDKQTTAKTATTAK